jgi:hypothetical protein
LKLFPETEVILGGIIIDLMAVPLNDGRVSTSSPKVQVVNVEGRVVLPVGLYSMASKCILVTSGQLYTVFIDFPTYK